MKQTNTTHKTVFLNEAVEALEIKKDDWYIDATFGAGGHTELILQNGGKVIAFDFDDQAIAAGQEKLKQFIVQKKLIFIRENFGKLRMSLEKAKKTTQIKEISGILFDFGTSTDQLMNESRGFSFSGSGELDMRMDDRLGVKAKDLLALLSEKQLSDLFFTLGGEKDSRKIAKTIVALRKKGEFITTNQDLASLIEKTKKFRGKTHPATKVFQALRIAVNDELDNIENALPQALDIIASQARMITISFHEGEDRIAKQTFKKWHQEERGEIITKKAIMPDSAAIAENPRCRSAKMRIFEKK
jgi:16S rRNA (cytosine1402-N4)-methyltransferase